MQTTPCVPACSSVPVTVQVPGGQGAAGTNGQNAFTTVAAPGFTIPTADGVTQVTAIFVNTGFMTAGLALMIPTTSTPNIFQVVSVTNGTTAQLVYVVCPVNVNAGASVTAGTLATPTGLQGLPVSTPITIANGGTGSTTKAGAQAALGLGNAAIVSTTSPLTQAITASFVQVGALAVTIPSAGTWLIWAFVRVLYNGVTFSSNRTINVKLQNVTQAAQVAATTVDTGTITTTSFPDADYSIPPAVVTTFAANDSVQLQIDISVINSAGTLDVVNGMICAIPLHYS